VVEKKYTNGKKSSAHYAKQGIIDELERLTPFLAATIKVRVLFS
jgi:hypothetical protein